jgi:membrane protein
VGASVAQRLGAETAFGLIVGIGRWPVILISVVLCFDLVYNTAPSMWRRKSSWVTPGAFLALILWLTVSLGFRYYVARFAMIADFYGSLAVVILLMVWLFLTSIAILAGIALNTEIHLTLDGAEKNPTASRTQTRRS